jgi:S1-C subfamily serine protease
MHPDGTVYRRYGSGDGRDSEAMLSEASLIRVLRETLDVHAARKSDPLALPPVFVKRTVEDLPPMKRRLKNGAPSCIHCHTVSDMERELAEEEGRFKFDDAWRHPPPARVGFELDRDDQARVSAVKTDSPAARAGLRVGDRMESIAKVDVRTEADARFALDSIPMRGGEVAIVVRRGDARVETKLDLRDGWRRGDALDLSWRSDVWSLRPNPGFGGRATTVAEKRKLGLPEATFALKVGYLIDFGPHPEDGRNAKAAGLRKGDVVFGVDGVADFLHERHFQAWWRLRYKPGAVALLDVLRNGERLSIRLPILP